MRTRTSKRARLTVESLEARWKPAMFTVDNFNAAGEGSLTAAAAGARISSGAWPTVTES